MTSGGGLSGEPGRHRLVDDGVSLIPLALTMEATFEALLARSPEPPQFGIPRPRGSASVAAWLAGCVDEFRAATAFTYAVALEGEGIVGTIRLGRILAEERSAQLSYWIALPCRRRQLASRALGLLLTIAFNELGLEVLFAPVQEANAASRRLLEKMQFASVGTLQRMTPDSSEPRVLVVYSRKARSGLFSPPGSRLKP